MKLEQYNKHIFTILSFFAFALLIVTLKFTSVVTLPLTVAILISCATFPAVKKLNTKLKLPWILATLIVAVLIVVLIIILLTIIGTSVSTIVNQLPKYEEKFTTIYQFFCEKLNINYNTDQSFFQNLWGSLRVRDFLQKAAFSVSGNVISLIRNLSIILLFSVFLLIEMKNGREKVNAMFKNHYQNRVVKILNKTISETVRYISIKFLISLATGVLVYLIVLPIGVDFAVLWGFFSFIMNFIPTFGSIFSVGITTLFTLIQFYPNFWQTIYVLILTTIVNLTLGNIVEPKIEGKNLGISPFVILVGLTFFNWIWGFVGMILAVPMIVIIKIICENVSFLHPIAILLGNRPQEVEKEFVKDEENDLEQQDSI